MAIEQMKMPQLGESVTEGTISKWLVSPGDKVNKYDPIAEVMTDKVNAEVPSSFTGTITNLTANEGDTLQVGEVFCEIEVEGTSQTDTKSKTTPTVPEKKEEQVVADKETDQSQKKRYSPAVLRLADEHGIDLSLVEGTGAGGRITRKDMVSIIENGGAVQKQPEPKAETNTKAHTQTPSTVPASASIHASLPGDVEVPITPIRQAIATNMLKSKHEIPHAWTMMEVDVTNLVTRRKQLKDQFKAKEGFNLTFFAFFVKAVAQALKEFPQMNSMWAGDKIIQKQAINLSIAVATDDALFVPVIKNADEKTIKGIAKEIHELAGKVRSGQLKQSDMEGGTFTVNNTGSFGSIQSMGIINHPQAAILQVESIVQRPVVIDGMIAVRDMVNLCLSLDHRVLDGVICGRFLQRIKQILEEIDERTSVY
ncbi:dihydrolipoamide acetyltransferase family protein [Bacillus sp. NPDC077027]|uniref:dihydrolipoamide acetyltransferase family protein n=1 Tax=Bacillus sp. NPDC077027 TaxID=3390548 RepID=UPI003D035A2B